jgi:hypothetical protein
MFTRASIGRVYILDLAGFALYAEAKVLEGRLHSDGGQFPHYLIERGG